MEEPNVCARRPEVKKMEPGTYWWCSCGHSSTQPFCDGSHKGTGRAPVKYELTEPATVAWCLCKHTGNAPCCDGSHAKLPAE